MSQFTCLSIPELVAAMLACARLGAVHMVVFGGFAASSLRDRMIDCDAKVLITADGGYRGSKVIELKKIADEAVAETPTIEKTIVVRRTGTEVSMKQGRDMLSRRSAQRYSRRYCRTLASQWTAKISCTSYIPAVAPASQRELYMSRRVRGRSLCHDQIRV